MDAVNKYINYFYDVKDKHYPFSLIQIRPDTIACSMEGNIRVWTLPHMQQPHIISNPEHVGNSLILLQDGRLAAGSLTVINLFKPSNYKLLSTLKGHSGQILSLLQLKDTRLISSSEDCSFKLWNVSHLQCVLTLRLIASPPRGLLQLNDGRLLSSSFEAIQICDTRFFRSKKVTNRACYSMLQLKNGALAFGFRRSIEIWDPASMAKVIELTKNLHGTVVCLVGLRHNYFASCSSNMIHIWNSKNYKYKGSIEEHKEEIINAIQLDDARLMSIDIQRCLKFSKVEYAF